MDKLPVKLLNFEAFWVLIVALSAALLLASHQQSVNTVLGLLTNYAYWLFRILMQTGIFIAVFNAMERMLKPVFPAWGMIASAIMLSLIPYALSVTAFDLVVGLPEIGLNEDTPSQMSTSKAFAYELLFLLDNHVALCLMLILPRMMQYHATNSSATTAIQSALAAEEKIHAQPDVTSEFQTHTTKLPFMDPPLKGELCSVEAQEHYIKVVSMEESRLVLYRFSDVVRQFPDSLGLQVHRSHWVANSAVKEIIMQGQTIKIALKDGRFVPVSRTFRQAVQERFAKS